MKRIIPLILCLCFVASAHAQFKNSRLRNKDRDDIMKRLTPGGEVQTPTQPGASPQPDFGGFDEAPRQRDIGLGGFKQEAWKPPLKKPKVKSEWDLAMEKLEADADYWAKVVKGMNQAEIIGTQTPDRIVAGAVPPEVQSAFNDRLKHYLLKDFAVRDAKAMSAVELSWKKTISLNDADHLCGFDWRFHVTLQGILRGLVADRKALTKEQGRALWYLVLTSHSVEALERSKDVKDVQQGGGVDEVNEAEFNEAVRSQYVLNSIKVSYQDRRVYAAILMMLKGRLSYNDSVRYCGFPWVEYLHVRTERSLQDIGVK